MASFLCDENHLLSHFSFFYEKCLLKLLLNKSAWDIGFAILLIGFHSCNTHSLAKVDTGNTSKATRVLY